MLKKILLGLAVIIAIPFIAALFIKTDYSVTRTVTIDKPVTEVFDYIKHLKNQDNFSKWAQMDPEMVKTFRGTDATVGFVSAWASENPDVGVGEQEIIAIDEGKRIDFELRFISPFEATSPAYMTTEAISTQQTKVDWDFSGHMDYPMNLMFLFVDFETMIGADLQQGLDSLKVILEKE
ncbi:SRPBCC family protein [Shewanella sp. MF05960]|uniref:SRPBCC family protein n=1 Tax=Shewanella sp. MF05960 TaxID=3434874 RepID=UPI003D7B6205